MLADIAQTTTATQAPRRGTWRLLQATFFVLGVTILALLWFRPNWGLHAFWNVLIPLAPLLVVFLPGLWRNVCPLASTVLMPRHFGLSKRVKMSSKTQDLLAIAGTILLFVLVPLRHIVFDTGAHATFFLLTGLAALGFSLGLIFDWKSAWCSGLCPIHPVERLYGSSAGLTFANAHCSSCAGCVDSCPDASSPQHFLHNNKRSLPRLSRATVLVGGFPGFIWGWFQVQDYAPGLGWNLSSLAEAYTWPAIGMMATLALYLHLRVRFMFRNSKTLSALFVAASASCYYWYRIPALIGFGKFPQDGMLVDLSGSLSFNTIMIIRALTITVFLLWFLGRRSQSEPWIKRPRFVSGLNQPTSKEEEIPHAQEA